MVKSPPNALLEDPLVILLSDHGEADDLVGVIDIALVLPNPGRNPPRHEVRIALDVCRKIEKLILRIRQRAVDPMDRHDPVSSSVTIA